MLEYCAKKTKDKVGSGKKSSFLPADDPENM